MIDRPRGLLRTVPQILDPFRIGSQDAPEAVESARCSTLQEHAIDE